MTDRAALERWNSRFSGEGYLFGTEPNRFLAAQRDRLPRQGRALTIADGEGRNGAWLARQGLEVTSVEYAPAAIAKARRLAEQHGVSLDIVQADVAAWDWGEPRFDVVAGIFIQFAGPALRTVLFHRMRDVLLPGGLLLIEGYTPAQLRHGTGGPPAVVARPRISAQMSPSRRKSRAARGRESGIGASGSLARPGRAYAINPVSRPQSARAWSSRTVNLGRGPS